MSTFFIIMAAFLISSKHAIKPKVRIWAFSFYIAVCICFGLIGFLTGLDGLVLNQTILFFINCRGIYNAVKELRLEKPPSKRDPFEVIVPKDFWIDILKDGW